MILDDHYEFSVLEATNGYSWGRVSRGAGGLEEGVDGTQDKTPVHKGGRNDVARLKKRRKGQI